MRISSIVLTASVAVLVVSSAVAQESSVPPAHIAFVEGQATIERGGEVEPAALNMPVVEGDRVRTTTSRLQIAFPDGSAVDLEPDSEVEYLGGARVRIYAGTVENRPAVGVRSPSAEYLPADSQAYATDLDQNGAWQYDASYGNVWYPTVAADWRPYYYGYWTSVPTYGWTWIGYNRWAWPTHHYGRWGYAHNRWFWIPGRVYSSAWVSWGTAPGYVSWCPLGWDSRPVVALSVGYSHGWNAWTIVPRDHFGWRGYPAHRYAVPPSRIAASTPFIVQRTPPAALSTRAAGGYVSAPRSGAYTTTRSGVATAPARGLASGSAAPRYGTSPLYSIHGTPPDARGARPTFDRRPPTSAPSFDRRPVDRGSVSRPVERGGASRAPAPSFQRPAPAYRPPSPPSRPSPERARPSYQPPPSSGSRPGGGGSHAAGNAPRGDRGPSPSTSRGGGSHGGSHGGGSQGTAVRRPR